MAVGKRDTMLGGHHLDRDMRQLAGLVLLAAVLFVGAAVGMAYVAGFEAVRDRLVAVHWPWLGASLGGEVLAFAGYWLGYRGINRVEGGPNLDPKRLWAIVAAGFGGFLAQGGGALDHYAMEAAGTDDREAKVRVTALGGFEHGSLAFIVCPTAIALLIIGVTHPPGDYTWPWAAIPPVGFAVAIWVAERQRDRLRDRDGWRGRAGVFFDAVHAVREIIIRPREHGSALAGMLLFWGADMFSLWAGFAAFGAQVPAGVVILGYGVGYVLTQRTLPLGGAGLLMTILPPALWYAGVPFSAAVLGVFVHRFFSLWVFMPLALAALPTLRALGRSGETEQDEGEPALES